MPASASSAVGKALALLEQVAGAGGPGPGGAGSGDGAVRLSQAAAGARLHRATAYRVLADLVERGWVSRVGERYLPGPALVRVAASAAEHSLAGLCRPVLEHLERRTSMMVNLQVLTADRSRVVDVVRPEALAMISDLRDELLPVHRFAGPLALVAALEAAAREPYLRAARAEGAQLEGPDGLSAALERAAADGFALQRGRAEHLVASLSRAVALERGAPVCALTLVGPVARFDDGSLASLRGALAEACDRLTGEVLRATSATSTPAATTTRKGGKDAR